MKKIKTFAISIFAISCVFYVVAVSTTYSTRFANKQLEGQLTEITTANDELQIYLTTNLSRTELMEKYPKLELHDNIFYLEEEQ